MRVDEANIINKPLLARAKIIFFTTAHQTCFMNQFVKALPSTGNCLNYICKAFPALTIKKLKADIFDDFSDSQTHERCMFCAVNDTHGVCCLTIVCFSHT